METLPDTWQMVQHVSPQTVELVPACPYAVGANRIDSQVVDMAGGGNRDNVNVFSPLLTVTILFSLFIIEIQG